MTYFIGSGIQSQIVAAAESTYGVAATLTGTPVSWEFTSETLESTKTTVQGAGLHAGGLFPRSGRRILTNWAAGGQVTMDLPAQRLNMLLQQMFGSRDQTVLSTNGALAQIASSGSYKAVHIPGDMGGQSWTIQKGVPSVSGAVEPFTYVGCKVSDWEVSVQTGAIAQLAVTYVARNELAGVSTNNGDPLNTSTPALATWTDTAGMDVFHFREASLITGTPSTTANVTSLGSTSTISSVRSASVKMTMSYDTSRYFLGNNGFMSEPLENNLRSISGTFVVEWLSTQAQYEAYSSDVSSALELTFVGPVIGSSGTNTELLTILVPNIKLDGEAPKIGGPEVVTQNVSFTGLDDETNNPIQATYQTLDSAD